MSIFHINKKAFDRNFAIAKCVHRMEKVSDKNMQEVASFVRTRNEQERPLYSVENGIAHISISGILIPKADFWLDYWDISNTSFDVLLEAIAKAESDSEVSDIQYDVHSPGGYVELSDLVCEAIFNGKKPSVAVISGMCCSLAYKFASQADKIIATTRGVDVGSIGTVVDIVDWSGWEEAQGIRSLSITNRTSTDKRPDVSSEEGLDVIRDEMDENQEVFEFYYNRGREGKANYSLENVRSLNGRVVKAKKALALGLIDQIGGEFTIQKVAGAGSGVESGISHEGETEMGLKSFLEGNPEAKAQYDADISAASAAGSATGEKTAKAEQDRVLALVSASGAQLSASVMGAIESGTEPGQYALSVLESQRTSAKTAAATVASQVPAITPAPTAQEDAEKVSSINETDAEREKKATAKFNSEGAK